MESFRESYADSDDSDEEEQSTKSRPPSEAKSFDSDSLIRNQRLSWVSGSVGGNTDLLRKRMYRIGLNLLNKKPEKVCYPHFWQPKTVYSGARISHQARICRRLAKCHFKLSYH